MADRRLADVHRRRVGELVERRDRARHQPGDRRGRSRACRSAPREDADKAVAAAQKAFDEVWFDTPPKERSAMLLKLADAIDADADEHRQARGRGRRQADLGLDAADIPFIIDNLRFFAGAARVPGGQVRRASTRRASRASSAASRSGSRSDLPVELPADDGGLEDRPGARGRQHLVLKPAELTPLTALRLAELAADIFPPGVFNVVTGHGSEIGDQLVRNPDVRLVSVTGDTSTGKMIAGERAADTVKRVHLELGRQGAGRRLRRRRRRQASSRRLKFAGYTNTGQDCTASCRVVVGLGRSTTTCSSELVPAVESIKVGDLVRRRRSRWARSCRERAARERGGLRRPGAGGRRQGPDRRRDDRRRRASTTSRRSSPTSTRRPRSCSRRSSVRS